MLYYLFETTVTVEANEIREFFTDTFPAKFPDNTEQAVIEADAQRTINEVTQLCKKIFYYMHPCVQPCAKLNIQAGFNIHQSTEEEYNLLYIEEEE